MNIAKHLNLILVCMKDDGFSKQHSHCTAHRIPWDGVQIHLNHENAV